MSRSRLFGLASVAAAALAAASVASQARAAATIQIVNIDGAGTGFNDPTPVVPVGGNFGTSLGQQRLIVFQHAASIWGATITSSVTIQVAASSTSFGPSQCSPGEALGIHFATPLPINTPNLPFANTQYPPALANKIAGTDLDPTQPDFYLWMCPSAASYYLGLDGNHGSQVDLVIAVVHQIAHGLGFWNFTAANSGAFLDGYPSIWDRFLFSTVSSHNKLWIDMTEAERFSSMRLPGPLVWVGANVTAAVPVVLAQNVPYLLIAGPEAGAALGQHLASAASFGAPLGSTPVTGQLMPIVYDGSGDGSACSALGALDAIAVSGNVALSWRSDCADVAQVKNVQNAGAIGAVIIHNGPVTPPPAPAGSDPTVTIPAIAISQADGQALLARLMLRGRDASGVTAGLGAEIGSPYLGADPLGRAIVNTPAAWSAATASHFHPSARPNQLMEPTLGADVGHFVEVPYSLTYALLRDIGW